MPTTPNAPKPAPVDPLDALAAQYPDPSTGEPPVGASRRLQPVSLSLAPPGGGSPRALKLTDDDDKMNRAAAVEKLFTEFDKAAKEQVAKDSPLAARYLAAAAIKQREPAAHAHQTKDLATNDALVQSLGVNMQDYIEKVQGN